MKDMKKIIQSKKTLILCAALGIIVPVLDNIVFFILGAIRPGYNPLTQTVSELGEVGAPNSTIASLYFIISGVLLILFSFGLYNGINKGKGSWIGPLFLVLLGIFDSIGSGIFPCDPGCAGQTFTGKMHLIVSIIGMFAMILAPFFIWRSLKEDERWEGYQTFSLIIGIVIVVMAVIFIVAFSLAILIGLFQRILYGVFRVWIFVLAINLLRIFRQRI